MNDTLKILKWAKKNGAVHLKVNGVEIVFEPTAQTWPQKPVSASLPPNLEYLQKQPAEAESRNEAPLAVRSTQDDPDLFAHNSDVWARQKPLPRRG